MTAAEVLEPAWELAAEGAPVSTGVAASLLAYSERLDSLPPTTVTEFFPEGRVLRSGEVFARPQLARVLKAQMDEEVRARREGLSRAEAIRRARDLFYSGWIAKEICDFQRTEGGLLREDDLSSYRVTVDVPLSSGYHGFEILACGPWSQGLVLLQSLNILECFDLENVGSNSPDYLHLVIEAVDRAYADREYFYGDPNFVDVPTSGLLSKEYARERAAEIDRSRASGELPKPGDAWRYDPHGDRGSSNFDLASYLERKAVAGWTTNTTEALLEVIQTPRTDTSLVAAADADGNLFAATPSDPIFLDTPVIPSLGFSCSGRGSQSRVVADHPASLEPGKRPRMTPSPGLAARDGRPFMAFGCPGGDAQPQGLQQVLLNVFHFRMNLQEAIEAPRVTSWNFPVSFAPNEYHPGRVDAEGRLPRSTLETLAGMGHRVGLVSDWSPSMGTVYAVANTPSGSLLATVDPRDDGAAVGW
jgi:gamma-glutamyltranspeptidase/glutathione hydrolase